MNLRCLNLLMHPLSINTWFQLCNYFYFIIQQSSESPEISRYSDQRCACADCCQQQQTPKVVGKDDTLKWSARRKEQSKVCKYKGCRIDKGVIEQISYSSTENYTEQMLSVLNFTDKCRNYAQFQTKQIINSILLYELFVCLFDKRYLVHQYLQLHRLP